MKKRFRILIVILVGGAAWVVLRPHEQEPIYEGKPISYFLRHPHYIPQLDSNAVPSLAKALATRDGLLQRPYAWLWYESPIWLRDHIPTKVEGWSIRMEAAGILEGMGDDAKPAIPALIIALTEDKKVFRDDLARAAAASALGKIGSGNKAVTDALIAALNDKEPIVRTKATNALREIDPEAAVKAEIK